MMVRFGRSVYSVVDEQVDAFFVAECDVQVAVSVEVDGQELSADAGVSTSGDFVPGESQPFQWLV